MKERVSVIVNEVAKDFNVQVSDIMGRWRKRHLVLPRHVAMYLCYKITTCSLVTLGKEFNRDHTTVHHAVQKIAAMLKEDPVFKAEEKRLRRLIEKKLKESGR